MQQQLTLGIQLEELNPNIIQNDDPRVPSFLTEWKESKFFALDIETKGIHSKGEALNPFAGAIRLIQIYCGKDEILVIDMDKPLPEGFLETLKKTLATPLQHPIGHKIEFDLTFIKHHLGFDCRCPRDTRILSILLWCGIKYSNKKRFGHSLKAVVERLFPNEIVDKTEQTSDWAIPELSNSQLNYAADDVIWTYKSYMKLCGLIRQADQEVPVLIGAKAKYSLIEIAQIECDAIPAFVEITLTGLPVNLDEADRVRALYEDAILQIYEPVEKAIKLPYTAQPKKLVRAFWEKFGILLISEVKSQNKEDKKQQIKCKQLSLFCLGKPLPPLKDNQEFSTTSANLFYHYSTLPKEKAEEAQLLLRLSLARSLKKCVDCLTLLIDSALQNNGYAKGNFTSLGNTGSGRSTCSGGGLKSDLVALNLQNTAQQVEHHLLDEFDLPNVRSVIQPKAEGSMFVCDLAASHFRLAALNSHDTTLTEILGCPDAHALVTSILMQMQGYDVDMEFCIKNKKTHPRVKYYRSIAKTATYTLFNAGGAYTFYASLLDAFVLVKLEDCQAAKEALTEAFPLYIRYQTDIKYIAKQNIVKTEHGTYVRYKTHDGRLFHVEAFPRTSHYGKFYYHFNLGEITSSMLLSPEAIVMKKSLIDILEFVRANRHLDIKLNSFCHDDVSGEDYTEDKVFAKFVLETVTKHFKEALKDIPTGLPTDHKKILVSNYSEK